MSRQLLIHRGIAELQIALVRDGVLERYWSEIVLDGEGPEGQAGVSRVGDIVLARVKRVLPALNAAFVDIGDERDGFLAARDAQLPNSTKPGEAPRIAELVTEGEVLLVQVIKDAIGNKGARLGLNTTIAGRYLVLAPNDPRTQLSRRIEDEAERSRLKTVVEVLAPAKAGLGFVVRTAAIGAGESELRDDAERLLSVWEELSKAERNREPVVALHRELGAIERALRDEVDSELDQIIIDEVKALETARAYINKTMPDLAKSIVLHDGTSPLFSDYGIEDDVFSLRLSKLELPSGGWITVEPTEALTAIDVNTGKHIARASLDSTALDINLEAAQTIARQIVLRSLGGLIVIDFIPLADGASLDKVTSLLAQQLKAHGAKADVKQVCGMNVVVVTVKRLRRSIDAEELEACTICNGHGRRRAIASVARDALRQVESAALRSPGKPIAMRVSTEVAGWLEERSASLRGEFGRRGIAALRVFPEAERDRNSFSVETIGTEVPP